MSGWLASRIFAISRLGPGEACDFVLPFVAYVLFLSAIFLSNSEFLAHYLFIGGVLPAIALTAVSFASRYDREKASWTASVSLEDAPRLFVARRSLIFWAAVAYLLMLFISWMYNWTPDIAVIETYALLSLEIVAFLCVTALLVVAYPKFMSNLFTGLCAVVAANAVINMVVFGSTIPFPVPLQHYRLLPSFGMPGYVGTNNFSLIYAYFFVAAIATVSAAGRSYLRRIVVTTSAAALFVAVLWTQTRSVYIAIVAAVLVLCAGVSRAARVVLLAVVIATGVVVAVVPDVGEALTSRGTSYRFEVWQKYVFAAVERPWLGYGPFTNIHTTLDNGFVIYHPHNLVLSAQIRGGLVAAIAMTFVILGGIYWSWRYWRREGSATPLCLITMMGAAGMLDYELVVTLPNWPWVTFWLPIGLCIGAELAARNVHPAGSAQSQQ